MSRPTALLVTALCAAAMLFSAPALSGATFTARTTNTLGTVVAAPDWTPPTVSLRNPGSPLKDTVVLTADATDAETGVANVTIQYLPENGSAWVTLCTATTAPYSCSWNTKNVTDGSYDLRAQATDNAGLSTTTTEAVRTVVANNLLVVLARPADVVRGTVPLSTTLYSTGTVSYKVDVQYAVTGTTTWKTITGCSGLSSPYACSWVTTSYPSQDYDLRAVAIAGGTSTTSPVVTDVTVDNVAPTVTMQDPGSRLSGTVLLAASATDNESGIARMVLQYAVTGTATWRELCTLTGEPYSCRYDTPQLADGSYSLRAVATDLAGNTTTSAAVTNRAVDNTVSSVSMGDPGAYLSGTVTLAASASSNAGVTSLRIQRSVSGSGSWTDVCTDTTSPYTCSWDTTAVADGSYDLRAILVDGSGLTTTSATIAGRIVDNTPLRGYDVQTLNGSATVGRLESGDTLRLTYTEQVTLTSITPGWTGTSLAVTLRLRDGGLLGLGNKGDTLDVLRAGSAVALGSVRLNEDYVKSGKTAQFNATMVASTTTVNGRTATVVTLTVGTLASGSGIKTAANPGTMVWNPSALATALNGTAASAAPTSELGLLDREF
jgi:hypothetical protein